MTPRQMSDLTALLSIRAHDIPVVSTTRNGQELTVLFMTTVDPSIDCPKPHIYETTEIIFDTGCINRAVRFEKALG